LQVKRRSEGNPMLNAYQAPVFSDQDRVLFDRLVPYDHWTRRADARIDFMALRKSIEKEFRSEGRPAVEPILCLKLAVDRSGSQQAADGRRTLRCRVCCW
jgi:hypothetical protein